MSVVLPALLGSCAWSYLALARGGFWRGREDDRAMRRALADAPPDFAWPRVTAVVAARDEADLIATSVGSLLRQRYPGEFNVVVVDDHSQDGTAAIATRTAVELGQADRLAVIQAPALAAGWTGKLWALATGIDHVQQRPQPCDFLLLTDADIHHDPDALRALAWTAVRDRHVLSSLMVHLHCESRAERALIPAFVFFFQMLYPFAWVNDPGRAMAAAAGGCMLVQRQALADAGGLAAIRGELIDDCALGRRMKQLGRIHLALGESVQSVRPYPTLAPIRGMVVRSAFAQLEYSLAQLVFVAVALGLVFIAPVAFAALAQGWALGLGLFSWGLMALLFAPTARRYKASVLWGLALPFIATAYLAFTLESALQWRLGRGGLWKGRAQAPGTRPAKAGRP